jgi:hypothetical protein
MDMKTVEYWRWRYRNVETGRICRTMFAFSAKEAAVLFPDAEQIEGTLILRQVDAQGGVRIALLGKGRTKDSHP